MSSSPSRSGRASYVGALIGSLAHVAVALATLSGCREPRESQVHDYLVRGQVTALPGASEEIFIRHEAIPAFVDHRGRRVGMSAMVMPFGVDDALDLAGIDAGDPVEFTLQVNWQRKPSLVVTGVRELPADTELSLEP